MDLFVEERLKTFHRHVHEEMPAPRDAGRVELREFLARGGILRSLEE
jgi:hypothetical protein